MLPQKMTGGFSKCDITRPMLKLIPNPRDGHIQINLDDYKKQE